MFYFAWYNATTMNHEVCVQKDKRSATSRLVESFDKSAEAEKRAAELNAIDSKGGAT